MTRRSLVTVAGLGLAAFALVAAISMTAPPAASAQAPSICDEYPDLPVCDPDPDPGPGPGPDGGLGPGGGQGPSADRGADGGELPFTGYPLTPLILLLLLLLALGLAIRTYLEMRDRRRARAAGDGPLGLT